MLKPNQQQQQQRGLLDVLSPQNVRSSMSNPMTQLGLNILAGSSNGDFGGGLQQGLLAIDRQQQQEIENQDRGLRRQLVLEQIAQMRKGPPGPAPTAAMRDFEYGQQNPAFREYQQSLHAQSGQPTYGRTGTIFQGPDGRFFTAQFGSDGSRKILPLDEGLTPSRGVSTIDTATGTRVIDRATGEDVREVNKDIAGVEVEKAKGAVQANAIKNAPKASATLRDLETQWRTVDRSIDLALNGIDWSSVGAIGSVSSMLPGTPAYDLARTLETIKANIGFDKLQSMRDNSPTGGALGQVSEFENRLLQSVRGSLEQGQSPDQIRENLLQIKSDLRALQLDRRQAFEQTYGDVTSSQSPQQRQPIQSNNGWSIQRVD